MSDFENFNALPLEERLAILRGDGEIPADPRLTEYREALHDHERGLSAAPGARERYLRAIAPYLEHMVERTPANMRKPMMQALSRQIPLGAIAAAFRATEEELESVMAEPVYQAEPVDEIDRLQRMPYDKYRRTEHWQKTRADALERAEHHCQLCNQHAGPLQVHHRTYKRLGCERPADLLVLCDECHKAHHDRLRAA